MRTVPMVFSIMAGPSQSGTMIIMVQSHLSFSRVRKLSMSEAHHSPSSGGTT